MPDDPVEMRLKSLSTMAGFALVRLAKAAPNTDLDALARSLLRPAPRDFEKVFRPEAAERLRVAYERLWEGSCAPRGRPGQTDVRVSAATSEDLRDGTPRAGRLPGGWREIAALLQPDRVWLRWRFVAPGESSGTAFDGLVWMDDHWAWFPKPWKALASTPDT